MTRKRHPKGTERGKGGQFASDPRPDDKQADPLQLEDPKWDFSKGFHVTVSQKSPDGSVVQAGGMVTIDEDGTMKMLGIDNPQYIDQHSDIERRYSDFDDGADTAVQEKFLRGWFSMEAADAAFQRRREQKFGYNTRLDQLAAISWAYDDPYFGPQLRVYVNGRMSPYSDRDKRPSRDDMLTLCGEDDRALQTCYESLTGYGINFRDEDWVLLYKDIKITEQQSG